MQGFCKEHPLALNITTNAEDCLAFCQTNMDCQWYSYFPETDYCVLTEECATLDQSCADCTAGQKECYEGTLARNVNMIKICFRLRLCSPLCTL
jgi:hypothetical protein